MLRFVPEYKQVVWGGQRLAQAFGRDLPEGPIGESWELVEIDGHESLVAAGPDAGTGLGTLWRRGRLGGSARGSFPLLVKWLDTHAFLSVQVHPDEAYESRYGHGRAKTEIWLVAQCEPDAIIYRGHREGLDEARFRAAVADGTVADQLVEHRPVPGELLLVPGGTLHAIGPGCLLLEVQQPSDTTYRAYDWRRLGADGRPRELHLEQACRATRFDRPGAPAAERREMRTDALAVTILADGERSTRAEALRVFAAHAGPVRLSGEAVDAALAPGSVVVAEPRDGAIMVEGAACALLGEGPKAAA